MAPSTSRHSSLLLTAAAPVLITAASLTVLAAPAFAGPYPPPDQPATTTSSTETTAGSPVTLCADHYAPASDIELSDNSRRVTTVTTDAAGKGCVTVAWSAPEAKAHVVNSSALRAPDLGSRAGAVTGIRLVAYRAPAGTVCHTMAYTGPDASGATTTTSVQVCVEPGDSSGGSSSGGHVSGNRGSASGSVHNEGSGLPFTGARIAGMVLTALVLLALGTVTLGAVRRRSASS